MQSPQHCVAEGPGPLREDGSMQGQIYPALCCRQEENPCDGHLKPDLVPTESLYRGALKLQIQS